MALCVFWKEKEVEKGGYEGAKRRRASTQKCIFQTHMGKIETKEERTRSQ